MPAFDEAGFPNLDPSHVLDELARCLCELDEDTLLERPSPGTVAITTEIHECGEAYCQCAAHFDMLVESKDGRRRGWVNLCASHARERGLTTLGMGRAQYLLHPDELDEPSLRALARTYKIPLDDVLGGFRDDEREWSKIYRTFGFLRTERGKLVRRGVRTTVWAEPAHLASNLIGIKIRRRDSFAFDDRGWDAVHPISWSQNLVREVLFQALKDEPDLPRSSPLTMSVREAEEIVRVCLDSRENRISLHDHLCGDDLTQFGEAISRLQPSPYGRATAVASAASVDYDLLRRIWLEHPEQRHRLTILRRDDCPEDLLLAAVDEPGGRRALLDRDAGIPAAIIEPLFTRIALSSSTQELRDTMFRAAVHPAVPVELMEGILEKVLTDRDLRTSLIAEAASLDEERGRIVRTSVLRKTHRGKVQEEVMAALLGPEGLGNRGVVDWIATLTDRPTRERALRWIDQHAKAARGDEREDASSGIADS